MWRGGCGCGCGHGESNSCFKIYTLRARLYYFNFVQSVNLEGVGKCVCGCGCEELWVWGGACEEVDVGRWVWGGGCGEVGVGGGCGELGVGKCVWEVGVGVGCGYGEVCRCGEVGVGRCVGVGRWVWGGECGEVGVGKLMWVWAWRIQLLYKNLHRARLYHLIFVCPIRCFWS